ncbi:long-chain-fatty-acid--CoA ligase [Microbacterium thalassium]|nr:long-chain-fatty-acid--CoA ligase [Microbacterium thalassium]GLK25622.1 long-chain-fatty-acid--CoA ligase [Microbacterium thalassium]
MTVTVPGLMQDFPLTTNHFLWRMARVNPRTRVVTILDDEGTSDETTLGDVADRSLRLAASLDRLGIRPGDRIGTVAWNTVSHLIAYFGVMSMGAVLHTVNLRLHAQQIVWTVNHAEDRILIVDDNLAELVFPLLADMPTVERIVVIGGGDVPEAPVPVQRFDALADADPGDYRMPELDERSAAALCYTSGTTGDPKGVLYSHRSIAVHSLIMSGSDVFGIAKHDVVLATVPMFHAMGWGLPFLATMAGADLVLPGRHLGARSLARTIAAHRVTWSTGVPTIWMDLLRHVDAGGDAARDGLAPLRKLILGGTKVPEDLIRRFARDLDVEVISGWGMTEIFPGGAVAATDPRLSTEDNLAHQTIAGRISPFYELRLVDDEGIVQPHDGRSRGEIQMRGPSVAGAYFRLEDEAADRFDDGWLRTGDIGTVDAEGWVTLVDRSKDMIKSGGEWISSADLESALQNHELVAECAVVGRPDDRWSERPHAFVVLTEDVPDANLKDFLAGQVPKWWIPEEFERIDAIPRTTTGKFDKKLLRSRLTHTDDRVIEGAPA